MIDPGLEGRVVLVTGANNPCGIGAAVAGAFAAQGARLFLHYFRPPEASTEPERSKAAHSPGAGFYAAQQAKSADEVLTTIRGMGAKAQAFEADLTDPSVIQDLFERAERSLGRVEILINNAAHWEADTFIPPAAEPSNRLVELWSGRPASTSATMFDRLFSVNTRAPMLLIAEFARRHIAHSAVWGRIVNVSTDGAECFPSEVSYGASKFALESYTRSSASELGKFGITVNVVSLGPVQTGWITPELGRGVLPAIPLGRVGTAADVADVIVFLASEQARWVTGQRIYVGGGHAM